MTEITDFYQVFHKRKSVGFFLDKKLAEKYAKTFSSNIEGHDYPIEIRVMTFLDNDVDGDVDGGNFYWDAWK